MRQSSDESELLVEVEIHINSNKPKVVSEIKFVSNEVYELKINPVSTSENKWDEIGVILFIELLEFSLSYYGMYLIMFILRLSYLRLRVGSL